MSVLLLRGKVPVFSMCPVLVSMVEFVVSGCSVTECCVLLQSVLLLRVFSDLLCFLSSVLLSVESVLVPIEITILS